jgi:dihydroorotate dehydrogenase
MYSALRPLLFLLPPDLAHAVAFAALAPVEHSPLLRAGLRARVAPARDGRLAVRVMGLDFANPIGLAAGFDKNARRARSLAALGFGHLELGTVTARAQGPNPRPNLFRLPADRAIVNRLGFPNHGAERLAARLRRLRGEVGAPIGVSIGKSRSVPIDDLDAVIADYLASFDHVADAADFVVVNVSSPNTDGLRTMQAQDRSRALLGAISSRARGRASGAIPVLAKVAPDLADGPLDEFFEAVRVAQLTGVVCTNTTVGRAGLATDSRTVAAVGAGGLSGPPIRARSLEVVRRARSLLGRDAVVIGVGGVERAEHAMALVRGGANLVQIYTGLVYEGPGAPGRIARDLAVMVEREGAGSISELVSVDSKG